jgi:hypothetical protein
MNLTRSNKLYCQYQEEEEEEEEENFYVRLKVN